MTAPFPDDLTPSLAALADAVIPPSDVYGVPGAGDPAIVALIVNDAGSRRGRLADAVRRLDHMAQDRFGDDFGALGPEDRQAVVRAYREAHGAEADMAASLVAQSYYRDDRVMASLGLEPRPPHPKGYDVKQGDWSLLDPVRRRDRLYRETEHGG